MLSTIWNDLRYSVRTLARNPGFTASAIVTIALGVGVNAGIFTTVNGLLFRDLPAGDAHELVTIQQAIDGVPGRAGNAPGPAGSRRRSTAALSEQTTTLSGVFGHSDPTRTTLGGESPQADRRHDRDVRVLRRAAAAAGPRPCAAGRGLRDRRRRRRRARARALVDGVRSRTPASSAASSSSIGSYSPSSVSRRKAPTAAFGFYRTQYFAPISTQPLLLPNEDSYGNDNLGWLSVIGRRAASIEQVRAELGVIAAQLDARAGGPHDDDARRARNAARHGQFHPRHARPGRGRLDGAVRVRAADRVRQRREPAARARDRAQSRDRHTVLARRESRTSDPPAADRKRADLGCGRRARVGARRVGVPNARVGRDPGADAAGSAAVLHRREPGLPRHRGHGGRDARHGCAVRPRAGVPGLEARFACGDQAGCAEHRQPARRPAPGRARRRAGRHDDGAHGRRRDFCCAGSRPRRRPIPGSSYATSPSRATTCAAEVTIPPKPPCSSGACSRRFAGCPASRRPRKRSPSR